jgi:DMSO/TMAO reductase YedYZ molybdopterin-dependent catalytic subunit
MTSHADPSTREGAATARLDPPHPVQKFPLAPHQLRDPVTRTQDTFVICHLGVPRIEPHEWSLEVDGLCARARRLSHAALLAYPRVEVTSVHECCGSPLSPFEPTRRVGNVRWSGVRLSDVLADCQPHGSARYVWSHGADHGEFGGDRVDAYCKDLPIERAAADVLIACEMNGAPLTAEHGAPARLVVPGHYGTNSVKWLSRITLAPERAPGAFTTRWYNDPVLDADGEDTGERRPVWAVAPESVIVSLAPRDTLPCGSRHEVWGWAWADGGVSHVFVRSSDGDWRAADLEPARGHGWQRFSLPWIARHRGPVLLASRATACSGERQPLAGRRNAVHGVPLMVL